MFIDNLSKLFNSLATKTILSIAILALFFIVILVKVIIVDMEKDITKFIHTAQLNSAKHLANNISQSIKKREKIVSAIAELVPIEFLNKPEELNNWLASRPQILSLFKYGVVVVGLDGKLISQSPIIKNRANIDYLPRKWFHRAVKSDKPILSKPFIGKAKKEPMMTISKSIKDTNGKTLAIIYGVMILSKDGFLKDLYEENRGVNSGFLLISTKHERFLASNIQKMILKPTPPKGKNLLHDKAMAGYRGVGVTKNAFGIEELSAMVSVSGTDWFLVIRKSLEESYKPLTNLKEKLISSVIVITTFIAILLLIILYRLVLKPIRDNSIIVKQIANSQIDLQTLPYKSPDEIGDFVDGFNSMVKRVQDDMNKQKQMAQMGELIGVISHQWKQPVSSISAVSQKLRFKNKLNKLTREDIDEISNNIDTQTKFMIDTIDEFRHFFNPNKEKHLVNLENSITIVIELLEIPLRENKVELKTDVTLPTHINSFNNLIIQVVMNLIKNANEQFKDQENKLLQIVGYEDNKYSYIQVKDNAGGVPEEVLEKIFDKYFSTKSKKEGTGIGLDFCKSCIEDDCDGSLSVHNEDGGAVFTIKLPK
jgi:signal transduction histidine kinase